MTDEEKPKEEAPPPCKRDAMMKERSQVGAVAMFAEKMLITEDGRLDVVVLNDFLVSLAMQLQAIQKHLMGRGRDIEVVKRPLIIPPFGKGN